MVHVVCTQCGVTDRISRENDAATGRCGKCGVSLFGGHPADLSASMLEKQIARSDIPVVVDIWAPWCGPCRAMAPQFEEAARRGEPGMRFVKLNSDQNQELAGRLDIRGIPTMILFRAGKEVARVSGAMSSADILAWTSRSTF